jgi:hypothetical protein
METALQTGRRGKRLASFHHEGSAQRQGAENGQADWIERYRPAAEDERFDVVEQEMSDPKLSRPSRG